jgi:UDP-glucose 4-epimerase
VELAGGRFVVTGGSGFIGSHVVDELVDAGALAVVFDAVVNRPNLERALAAGQVQVVEGDVTDAAAVRSAIFGADGVFHLAVLPLGDCVADPRRCLEVNVVGTFNVLEAARESGVRKVVFSSASSVYGETPETMDEAHPLEARTMYGASKIAGEYVTRAFEDMYGLEYVILRYMNVYGPRQQGGLVVNVLRRILAGEPPVINGDGSQSFDFVHVRDVARANLAAMRSEVSGEAFNVGSGAEVTVREVVERLLDAAGSDLSPEYRTDERVLMARRVGSSEKARRTLGWEPGVGLDDGVRDVVQSLRG